MTVIIKETNEAWQTMKRATAYQVVHLTAPEHIGSSCLAILLVTNQSLHNQSWLLHQIETQSLHI